MSVKVTLDSEGKVVLQNKTEEDGYPLLWVSGARRVEDVSWNILVKLKTQFTCNRSSEWLLAFSLPHLCSLLPLNSKVNPFKKKIYLHSVEPGQYITLVGFSFFFFLLSTVQNFKTLSYPNSIASFSVISKAKLLLFWLHWVLVVVCGIFSYGMGNPGSPTRDQAGAPCMGSSES